MSSGRDEQHAIDLAWQRFDAGNLDEAIDLARAAALAHPSSAGSHAALGYFLMEAGRPVEAQAVLVPAIDRAPGYAPLHWYRGLLLKQQGDLAGAAIALQCACSLDEQLTDAADALAWVLHDLGQVEQSLAWVRRSMKRSVKPGRLLLLGWLLQKQEQWALAVDAYENALKAFDLQAPEQPRLHLLLAQCLVRKGETARAHAVMQQAMIRWPTDCDLLAAATWQSRDAGDLDNALRLANEWTRLHPLQAAAWHALGVVYQELGQFTPAEQSFLACQQLDPNLTDAVLRRSHILRGWKQFEGARWLLQTLLHKKPGDGPAQDLLAQVFLDMNEDVGARGILVARLRTTRGSPEARRLLAEVYRRRGRSRMALRCLRHSLLMDGCHIEALRAQAWLALELGNVDLAVTSVRVLLQRLPSDTHAQAQAAFVFAAANRLDEAQTCAEAAAASEPDFSEAWRALSVVRLRQGRLDLAESTVKRALQLAPSDPDILRQMGWVMLASARPAQAQLAFLRALESKSGDFVIRLELIQAQQRSGHWAQSMAGLDAVLLDRPQWPPALLRKGHLLLDALSVDALPGEVDANNEVFNICAGLLRRDSQSLEALKLAIRLVSLGHPGAQQLTTMSPLELLRSLWPQAIQAAVHETGPTGLRRLCEAAAVDLREDPWLGAAALYVRSLQPQANAHMLALEARDWYRGLKIRAGFTQLPIARRAVPVEYRPRIAYVASQLHHSLMRRVLAGHAGGPAKIFLYSNQPWCDLPSHVEYIPLVMETLAQSCAVNQIDVLIDAGGLHPFDGQYGLLQAYACRLAPVQVGWLGCWGAGGGLFDVLLTDAVAVPPEHLASYEEWVVPLQGGQWCWDPPLTAPAVSTLPCAARGTMTFGVTARSLRLNDACLDAYARILVRTAGCIRFIGMVEQDWPMRSAIVDRFLAAGVQSSQVIFDPRLSYDAYLQWFDRIDIVLDSFPASGGLSLLDALWMGVPVICLAGGWLGARQGASLLAAVGMEAWIAQDADDFCQRAIARASDTQGLATHRSSLRTRIQNSPLLDGRRVASQVEAIASQLKQASGPWSSAQNTKTRIQALAQMALDRWLTVPRSLVFPPVSTPVLSVVVVLFNQAGISRHTLQALADQRGVSFEVIVIDNASHDRTDALLACVHGARVVRNPENLGFLRAARQGAAMAQGEYLVFLNSDAILQSGALAAAWSAALADSRIGALGGRIVLTDGGLQEAGNAVFCDGSAGGIGRREDAFGHAARSARPTDYVSGVFLLTPMPVWRLLGGFDEAFAPAYYEDTDYCMRVWQAGFRVVYEPSVLVEHLEWGSATGNSATELMQRNRLLLQVRHPDWLSKQPKPQGLPLDGDRWRSPEDTPRLPRVLLIDNEVPHAFKGGGLPRARLMLNALAGWPVTLFPLWTNADNWQAVYQSLPSTVEVALGHGLSGLENFLERRKGIYDVLLVSRPPNLEALQPLRMRRPDLFQGIRLVYDAEALFALREIARAGVQKRPLTRAAALERVEAELSLADDASDVLVVSARDARHFEAAGHRTHILSHGIGVRRHAPGLKDRSGLLFVGALHPDTPNEDGLVWFIQEVLPLICVLASVPPVLTVVGVCLSEQVTALSGSNVRLLGPQPDLEPYYDAARVFIAPVRFAGGVPVKVIEAAANGVPTVASALLVRQLEWDVGLDVMCARNAPEFAAAVVRLLGDDAQWLRQQQSAFAQCSKRYDPEAFALTLRRVLTATMELPTARLPAADLG